MDIETLRNLRVYLTRAGWSFGFLAVGGLTALSFLTTHYQTGDQMYWSLGFAGLLLAAVSFSVLGISLIGAWMEYCELGRQAVQIRK